MAAPAVPKLTPPRDAGVPSLRLASRLRERFRPEHTTAVSMLDRLLHHCHTVVTDGDSYRFAQARDGKGVTPLT